MSQSDHAVVRTESTGFYHGYNKPIALSAKIIVAVLILWAISVEKAANLLADFQQATISNFGSWYIYVTAFFLFTCLALAILPSTGRIKLGKPDEKPESGRQNGRRPDSPSRNGLPWFQPVFQ